jgi:hypothetical protein
VKGVRNLGINYNFLKICRREIEERGIENGERQHSDGILFIYLFIIIILDKIGVDFIHRPKKIEQRALIKSQHVAQMLQLWILSRILSIQTLSIKS